MKRPLVICLMLLLSAFNLFGQSSFQTVAEKSDFKSTSDYNDVKVFI
jgi:hypothetical protein